MNRSISAEQVLPRPVETLPEYSNAKARRTLAERLAEVFGHSEAAATAIADAVVDPPSVRAKFGEVARPQVEEISVPGGTLLGIRTSMWAQLLLPDPRNPRIGPSRHHPFAVDPGSGGEESRFRPVPEPTSPSSDGSDVPELDVAIESRDHLEWASAQAAKWVLAENNWSDSIRTQGVMEAVWVVPTSYTHADGSATGVAMVTVEGSSRISAVHDILSVRSADIPYGGHDQRLRAHIRKLNDALTRGTATDEQLVHLRCERVPALILVGFKKHGEGTGGFPTAIKSLVALRHVDPPKAWGEGTENEALADEVLDELYRQGLVSASDRSYLAGSFTKDEAIAAHLPADPAQRAARILALFTTSDQRTRDAIRLAVTSQSTRKKMTQNLYDDLATALIVRSVEASQVKRVRLDLRHSFGQALHRHNWSSTGRDTEALTTAALQEIQDALSHEPGADPGPATLELAARAAYALILRHGLTANLGSAEGTQDRRKPGEVVDVMRRREQGVHQLAQALRDNSVDAHIRAVDGVGSIIARRDGAGDQIINDTYLRSQFPPPGRLRARSNGDTPTEILKNRLTEFSEAMERLDESYRAVLAVQGHAGEALIESDGADPEDCQPWRDVLNRIRDEIAYWERRFRQQHAAPSLAVRSSDPEQADAGQDLDIGLEAEDAFVDSLNDTTAGLQSVG